MARMVLGPLIESISNSIGATIISSWKGVTYARRKGAMMSNPCSEEQAKIRTRISAASKRWAGALTPVQRAGWESYAKGIGSASKSKDYDKSGTRVIIPDNRKVMSGFNAYLLLNCLAFSAETKAAGQWEDSAPNGISPPNPPTNLTCVCCHCRVPPQNMAQLIWVAPVDPPAGSRIRIWTMSLDSGVHRQLVSTSILAPWRRLVEEVTGAHGHTYKIDDLPGHYLFQIDCVSPHGLKSPPSNLCQVEIPNYDVTPCPLCPP